MKVLVAPDKFKGSLTATEVARSIARGIGNAAEVDLLPLADGGDGSVDAAAFAGYSTRAVAVHGATGEPRSATVATDGDTAVVELANACGIAHLPGGRLDALGSSSFGLGEALTAAAALGPRRIVIALGGSASTDGGIGMLAALGALFLDRDGAALPPSGRSLPLIARVDVSAMLDLGDIELVCATDVDSPLAGPRGAAAVFGPQKGANVDEVALLDRGLAGLVGRLHDAGFAGAEGAASVPGSGAAGGVGFACLLLGATMVSGAGFFLDLLRFDERVDGCDLVVTGEGRLDEQTASGKLVAVVAARSTPVPVTAVVGRSLLGADRAAQLGIARVIALSDRSPLDTAHDPGLSTRLLEQVGGEIAFEPGHER